MPERPTAQLDQVSILSLELTLSVSLTYCLPTVSTLVHHSLGFTTVLLSDQFNSFMDTFSGISPTEAALKSVHENKYFVSTQGNGCAAKSAKRGNS